MGAPYFLDLRERVVAAVGSRIRFCQPLRHSGDWAGWVLVRGWKRDAMRRMWIDGYQ